MLLTCLACVPAFAGTADINFGMGMKGTAGKHALVSVDLFNFWNGYFTAGAGTIQDNNLFNTTPIFVGEVMAHVMVVSMMGLFVDIGFGAAGLTGTNRRLSGHVQFPTMATIGLMGSDYALGVFYKHYSDGGLTKPNLGMDFVGLNYKFQF